MPDNISVNSAGVTAAKLTMKEKLEMFRVSRMSMSSGNRQSISGAPSGTCNNPTRKSIVVLSCDTGVTTATNCNKEQENQNPNSQPIHNTTPILARRSFSDALAPSSSSSQRILSPVMAASDWSSPLSARFSDCRTSPDCASDDSYVTAFERPRSAKSSGTKVGDDARCSSLHQALQNLKSARRSSLSSLSSSGGIPLHTDSSACNSTKKFSSMSSNSSHKSPTSVGAKSPLRNLAVQQARLEAELLREQLASLEAKLRDALGAQNLAEEREKQADERAILSLEDVHAHRFLNSLLEQKLEELENSLQSESMNLDEKRSECKKHKNEVKRLMAEREEVQERASGMISQMSEQMAQLQAYAMERIGQLEEELMEEQTRAGALESELAAAQSLHSTEQSVPTVTAAARRPTRAASAGVSSAVPVARTGRRKTATKTKVVEEDEDDEDGGDGYDTE